MELLTRRPVWHDSLHRRELQALRIAF